MGDWHKVKGYTKNDLFKAFRGVQFAQRDFVREGEERYGLKESTCKKKLRRGVKEGLVRRWGDKYEVVI